MADSRGESYRSWPDATRTCCNGDAVQVAPLLACGSYLQRSRFQISGWEVLKRTQE